MREDMAPATNRQGAQGLSHGCVQSLVKQAVESLTAAPSLRGLQGADTSRPILWAHGDRRIAAAQENKVHQKKRRAAVAVIERVDFDKAGGAPQMQFPGSLRRRLATAQTRRALP